MAMNNTPRVRRGGSRFLGTLLTFSSLMAFAAAAQEPAGANPDRTYRYDQWDVFTEERLSGNQLAVFMQPQGLTKAHMQSIAREMAFSETTFVFPSADEGVDFRVRIFGPDREFPFAGHPTIGTAFALARAGSIPPGTQQIVFGEAIGPVIVELEWNGEDLRFAWMHDRVPTFSEPLEDVNGVAAALGLSPSEIEPVPLPVQEVSAGARFLFVPLASRAAVDHAKLDSAAMSSILEAADLPKQSVFIFSTQPADDGATAYGRKLGLDGREDPATGSAVGPLGGYLLHHGVVRGEEAGRISIRQGVQMGRPSWLHVQVGLSGDEITGVRVGGSSVLVGDGTIMLPGD